MFCKMFTLSVNTIAVHLHQQVNIPQLVNGTEMHLYIYFIITVLRTAVECCVLDLHLIDILSGCDVTFKICKETVKSSVLSLCFACRSELLKIDWGQIAFYCYCLGITVVRLG